MSPLEKNGQRASELLTRFSQPRGLDLDVIPQHQLLGIRMEVHLLVHPVGDLLVAVAIPFCRTGLKRHKRFATTARMPIQKAIGGRLEGVAVHHQLLSSSWASFIASPLAHLALLTSCFQHVLARLPNSNSPGEASPLERPVGWPHSGTMPLRTFCLFGDHPAALQHFLDRLQSLPQLACSEPAE